MCKQPSENEDESSRSLAPSKGFSLEKWSGDPDGNNRGINHPKDSDFACDLIPIEDILPLNLMFLLQKSKLQQTLKEDFSRWSIVNANTSHGSMPKIGTPTLEGITLQVLEDLIKTNPGSSSYRTKELVDTVFAPVTKKNKSSMLSELRGVTDSIGQKAVGKLEYFVSYSWYYEIGDLLNALSEFEKSLEREKDEPVYFFIDCVCINQYNPMNDLDALDQTIDRTRGLVMVITDWEDPVPFHRAWCLLEMALAIDSNVPLHIAMTKSAQRIFWTALFTDFDNVVKKMDIIDVRKAEATVQKDLKNIRDRIQYTIGYVKLNHKVISALKYWLVNKGEGKLAAMTTKLEKTDAYCDKKMLGYLKKLEVMAKLRRNLGDYNDVEHMYTRIYMKRNEILGPESIATLVAQCNYGNHLREMRQFKVAGELLSDCVTVSSKTLGDHHPITLISKTCWGLLQKNIGNLDDAENVLREVCTNGINSTGPWSRDWDNSTRSSNLALILELQGNTEEALERLKFCHKESKKMLGIRHDYVLTDMHNLGAVMWRSGDIIGAEAILRSCYEIRSELIGPNNLRTLMTLWWWSIALVSLGKLDKAREQLWEAMLYLEEVYGSTHFRVQMCRNLHEAITPSEWREKLLPCEAALRMIISQRTSYLKT